MLVRCEELRPLAKNTLIGFAVLVVDPPGIRIHDCGLHRSLDSTWVSLPTRAYEKKNGERAWARIVDWATRTGFYDFQTAALKAIAEFRGQKAAAK